MTDAIRERLQELSTKDKNELYYQIGFDVNSAELNIGPKSRESLIAKGFKLFIDAQDRLRDKICSDPRTKEYILDQKKDKKIEIAAGIASLLMPHFTQISACALALLLLNEGLEKYCDSYL